MFAKTPHDINGRPALVLDSPVFHPLHFLKEEPHGHSTLPQEYNWAAGDAGDIIEYIVKGLDLFKLLWLKQRGIYGKTSMLGDFLVVAHSIDIQINKNARTAKQENWLGCSSHSCFFDWALYFIVALKPLENERKAAPSAEGIYYYLIFFLTMSAANVATGFICAAQCVAKKFVNNHFIIGELFMRLLLRGMERRAAATAPRQRTHSARIFMWMFGPDGVSGIRLSLIRICNSLFIQFYYIIAGALDATRIDTRATNPSYVSSLRDNKSLLCDNRARGASKDFII